MPSANTGKRIKSLVIHFTAINYEKSVTALVKEGGLSSHYLVPESHDDTYGNDKIEAIQLVEESERAWHAGESYWQSRTHLNDSSIGIEIVNVPQCQWDEALSPLHTEYGDNRLCIFPDYDPAQIEAVISLAQDILKRNPDIEPTAVVGHADIAFNRKNDPGPRFPWFQLYQAGVGAWYENDTLASYWQMFNDARPNVGLIQAALRAYGYGITETGTLDLPTINAISAFQSHFLPYHLTGQPDNKTAGALFALLKKYFPQKANKLIKRYQNENAARSEAAAITPVHGQVDDIYPQQERSSRQDVNDKARFKSYSGRGEMTIVASEDADATIAINGETLNIASPLMAGKPYHYSLKRRTHDGVNTLAVASVTPSSANVHITIPYPTLVDDTAAWKKRFTAVDNLIKQDINNGFPGAVLLVVKNGAVVKHTAYGYARRYDTDGTPLASSEPMTLETGFDLASNTKMFATTLTLMHLSGQGKVDINQPVYHYLPEYRGSGRESRTVRDLLTHQSGYAPEVQFFTPNNSDGEAFFSQDKALTAQLLLNRVPFVVGNGVNASYSDTNFMLLGLLIERITGMTLDQYCERVLYTPLGLSHTLFNPLRKGLSAYEFAATELRGNTRDDSMSFPNIRTHTLRAEVHDEKAFYAMGGVSGHAGLFSTAKDMGVMIQMLLNGGGYGNVKLFSEDIVNTFTKPAANHPGFGLGWRRPADGANRWHFGPYASASAYGHTGWTGTVTVIDPELDMGIVLLTNARHSPIVKDSNGNPRFTGTDFETAKYGSVIAKIYETLLNAR